MFTKEYEIKFYEVDFQNKLKEAVLLNFLQDIAAIHAEELGFGYSYISKQNLGWFLLKYHIKFCNWPKDTNKIKIKTWPRGINKLSCIRDFEVFDANDNKIAVVSSTWVLIDLASRKIVNAANILENFKTSEKIALETNFPKIPDLKTVNIQKIFEVRYDDIDINKHTNNANYLTWALDTLWFEYRAKNQIEELEIQYKKEIKYGTEILSCIEFSEQNKTTLHSLKSTKNDEEYCKIKVKWK